VITMEPKRQCDAETFFKDWFLRLRGFTPYPWQTALFIEILAGTPPSLLYIPTGGGKTDVITAWLLAALWQIEQTGTTAIPRRLYFAVDRRVVVDQTEPLAETLLGKVSNEPELFHLLQSQTASEKPLVISVLRGQRVTEQEPLIADPSCFAIVLCTPDMVLSRLLFSAYGCSPRVASREAGLVGHDAWITLDEAHLSDAGRKTLEFVREHNRDGVKNFWTTCMSATPRSGLTTNALTLTEEDFGLMARKQRAHKALKIIPEEERNTVKNVADIVEQLGEWRRLIVYVERPKHAAELCDELEGKYDTTLLTGTMRGLEKSKLNLSPFKQGATCETPSVLICTSAGEVGLDVSCDILITEFTSLERLLQRLGRLNRWGECSTAYGYVLKVANKKAEDEKDSDNRRALIATLDYLESLPARDGWTDVSGYALYKNPAPEAAFSRPPKSLTLNAAILSQLANTSSIEHGIPVNEYIRGRDSAYQVNLVVRKKRELDALVKMDDEELQNYVAAVPVTTEELFKEPASKYLVQPLQNLLGERKTLFVSVTGVPEIVDAGQLAAYWRLREGTLYLPDDLACINERGVFKVGGTGTGDVFAKAQEEQRKLVDDSPEYIRYVVDDFGYACLDDAERSQEKKSRKEFLKAIDAGSGRKAKIAFNAGGLLYVKVAKKLKAVAISLTDHAQEAKAVAVQIVSKLGLNSDITNAVIEAAFHHDDGKAHPLWQTALKGTAAGEPLAKLPYFSKPKLLAGMRHEFVSALDANFGELVMWLIGSHHGRCRPSFPEKSYDPLRREKSAAFNAKLPFIFEHLVVEHGHWGLAYLEAIVRGVDIQSEEKHGRNRNLD